jgi:hypothetical protein
MFKPSDVFTRRPAKKSKTPSTVTVDIPKLLPILNEENPNELLNKYQPPLPVKHIWFYHRG